MPGSRIRSRAVRTDGGAHLAVADEGAIVSRLRLLVIGIGANIWPFHQRGVDAIGATVVGVTDARHEAATTSAAELGCRSVDTVDELLGIEADVAVILAPHPFHADLAIRCLEAGLDVLCEKPISENVADADRMVQAARETGRLLALAFQQRTRAEVVRARQVVAEGSIGEIQRVEVLATWPRRHSYFETGPWRATWQGEGGGILVNQGQHDLDLLCHLAGAPSSVVGRTSATFHGNETEDTATALLGWANGAAGTVHVSTAEDDEPQRIEITGTSGRIRIRPGRLEIWRMTLDMRTWAASPGDPYERPTATGPEVYEGGGGTHREIYQNLAAAIDAGAPLVASGDDALAAIELANAITYSSAMGREVSLPLDRVGYADLLDRLRSSARAGVASEMR